MKKFSSITRVNSHHISRDRKIKKILFFGVVALLLLLIVPRVVSYVASLVLSPVHAVESWILYSSDSFPYYVRERSVLVNELNDLKHSQSAQSGDRLTSQMLSKENSELRALLNDTGKKRILAGIIGRPNALPYDVLVLDKGTDDGITQGAPVYIGDDAVIGIVEKVFDHTSVVMLLTTPGVVSSVYIMGPDIYTTAEGVGGGQMRVRVPQGIALAAGDLVIVPGVNSGVYGAISYVASEATQPEQFGYVSPEVPLAGLRLVAVGETPTQTVSFEEAQSIVTAAKKELFPLDIPAHMLVTTPHTASTSASSTQTHASTSKPTP